MGANHVSPVAGTLSLEERLERCEVVAYPVCPFRVPEGDDRRFLLEQRLASRAHKNIGYDPNTGKASGFLRRNGAQAERLRELFAAFSDSVTRWLSTALPRYAQAWRPDRVSFRPEEEATRQLRLTARNDLLHVDAFPSRPTHGHRILRCFVNINPSEPRIWVTSESFGQLLQRFGRKVGLPTERGWAARLSEGLVGLLNPLRPKRSVYDSFMLRFHDFMKANDDFQEHCPKRYWTFAPGSAWLVLTDCVSHAALRGRYALEHSYFVAPKSLVLPEMSPPALLLRACGKPVLDAAA